MKSQSREQVIASMSIKDILQKDQKARTPFEKIRLVDYVSSVMKVFL